MVWYKQRFGNCAQLKIRSWTDFIKKKLNRSIGIAKLFKLNLNLPHMRCKDLSYINNMAKVNPSQRRKFQDKCSKI